MLEFREDTEEVFFDGLTINLDPSMANFKLAPTYTIYMATRFRASTHYWPELVPEERAVRLTDTLNRVADRVLRRRLLSELFPHTGVVFHHHQHQPSLPHHQQVKHINNTSELNKLSCGQD